MSNTSKSQIDRLGERLRNGTVSDEDLRALDAFRRSFAKAYQEVVETVRMQLRIEPTGRPAKSTTSIVEKLQRETIRLTQVQDIAGCRLVVSGIPEQQAAVEVLTSTLPAAVVVDRRERPSNNYRAVHVVSYIEDKPVEVQVRTSLQHLWAEFSEKLSDVVDSGIKYGRGDPQSVELLAQVSQTVALVEGMEMSSGVAITPESLAATKARLRELLELSIARASEIRREV